MLTMDAVEAGIVIGFTVLRMGLPMLVLWLIGKKYGESLTSPLAEEG